MKPDSNYRSRGYFSMFWGIISGGTTSIILLFLRWLFMRMKKIIFLLSGVLFLAVNTYAQLSVGGMPMDILGTKSTSSNKKVELVVPEESLNRAMKSNESRDELKPFVFALSIPVSFTPENSGDWYYYDDYNVWQLAIHSEGAKSINLIFDNFHIPDGARLFLFSEDKEDILGAFTSSNNKDSRVFATSPVVGENLIIQYEEPVNAEFSGELSIKSVNHDFIGIKAAGTGLERSPLGSSGSCNVNVNCEYLNEYDLEANSVCRILVNGTELCTGALVNNTSQDGTPYVYTANHCITTGSDALESVFVFNYESPYCGDVDGDTNHSISGSMLRASVVGLDFSLVELSEIPPQYFRPYYLGWNNSMDEIPSSTISIHHPNGDMKKMALDFDPPVIDSSTSGYTADAFLKVREWDEGTTEGGSSGAPLINQDMQLVGQLHGGSATCEIPINDYFSRFSMAWGYYDRSSLSLHSWLDPTGSGAQTLEGLELYQDESRCGVFTNFKDDDIHSEMLINDGDYSGYWGGTNDYGFEGFAEYFDFNSDCEIHGVSIGVAEIIQQNIYSGSTIRIGVYEGDNFPNSNLYSQDYRLADIDEGVMNYFEFDQVVNTSGDFYITYSLVNLNENDAFAVYLANRTDTINSFLIKDGLEWYSYQEKTGFEEGTSALIEVLLCNYDGELTTPQLKSYRNEFAFFPNPLRSGEKLTIKFDEVIRPKLVEVYDIMGRKYKVSFTQVGEKKIELDFDNANPGIYFVSIIGEEREQVYSLKISYMGY